MAMPMQDMVPCLGCPSDTNSLHVHGRDRAVPDAPAGDVAHHRSVCHALSRAGVSCPMGARGAKARKTSKNLTARAKTCPKTQTNYFHVRRAAERSWYAGHGCRIERARGALTHSTRSRRTGAPEGGAHSPRRASASSSSRRTSTTLPSTTGRRPTRTAPRGRVERPRLGCMEHEAWSCPHPLAHCAALSSARPLTR